MRGLSDTRPLLSSSLLRFYEYNTLAMSKSSVPGKFGIHRPENRLIRLTYLAVIGQQAVALALHITHLGVNGRGQPPLLGGDDLLTISFWNARLNSVGSAIFL